MNQRPKNNNYGIQASSCSDAAQQIGRNDDALEFAYIDLCHSPVLSDSYNINNNYTPGLLQQALASNTYLRNVHIHQCAAVAAVAAAGDDTTSHSSSTTSSAMVIANICRGLQYHNASIQTLVWSIAKQVRTNQTAVTALHDMMEANVGIQTLHIKRSCWCLCPESKIDPAEDAFAEAIFLGLKNNKTIKRFRLESYAVLSEQNKKLLLEILETSNRSIEEVHADFMTADDKNDYQLKLLLACNRGKWRDRLANPTASAEDYVLVLLEAMELRSVDNVSAIYHILRSFPAILLNNA